MEQLIDEAVKDDASGQTAIFLIIKDTRLHVQISYTIRVVRDALFCPTCAT